jgi:hypothetical protein
MSAPSPNAIMITRTEAAGAFAQWWAEQLAEKWPMNPDLDGKASADTFFEYALKNGAVIADA